MKAEREDGPLNKTFTKGLKLMEALANSEHPRRITDLAAELAMAKSNVHRLLMTLQAHGYVRQNPEDSSYELTTRLWELGNRIAGRMDLVKVARPAMEKLAAGTGETVHLSMLDGTDVLYLDKIESSHHIRTHTRVGARVPAFTMATGKAMLSHMPLDDLERFRPHLRRYTPFTRTTIEDLRADVELAARQGYATVPHGEWREGVAACACAILGPGGRVAGAIGMSGPDSRIKRRQLKDFAELVMEAACTVSTELGYRPTS